MLVDRNQIHPHSSALLCCINIYISKNLINYNKYKISACYLDNVDLVGGDITTYFNTDTLEQCKYACLETTECVAVTWYKTGANNGRCHVKNNKHNVGSVCSICISAYRSCVRTEGNVHILF